ncbi:hypothetical protein BGL34_04155 [Fructilactobacillus lindneri]|uniref:Uncharacterized protein n=2 Tax=Fructilactobacillus lindneri TaxID=53444 RepID=A0A0R2JXQ2_9LACO|nr:hypothetical protein [Fructilactobacillus lindneri]ANZ57691.1 hypothetical protein AYR60_02385 [Fructilactobacillus lindneri]ANZ58961.1 hypothetical protein AYR59_02385 [Fructilactobacillus lindneri]KRN78877.1 hypothetical protein IV52_GL001158 [Fructilactobacillus lindneri DSM 20690 = JCM 11027]POG97986.1 hypothetical protein BGL31_04600 [Fructilactobacillus lindneri]POG99040.1 hypothetical protein BGL32_06315 [Fructilactobacillus lindneri]
MKKNKKLLDKDLEKRFKKLDRQHPKPEKTNIRDIILKITIGLIAIILIGIMLLPTIINH